MRRSITHFFTLTISIIFLITVLDAAPSPEKQLSYAIQALNYGAVTAAIEKGASVDGRDSDGWPLFIMAVNTGKKQLVTLFIRHKVNVDIQDPGGKTALMHTIRNGEPSLTKLLLKNGANVNAHDSTGRTVLMYAARTGTISLVKKLLAAGADRTAKDNDGKTALKHAISSRNGPVVNELGSIEAQPANFIRAVRNGRTRQVAALLKNGVDVYTKDSDGKPAMVIAVEQGHPIVVRTLIQNGADPNYHFFKKGSLLAFTFHNKQWAAAEILLKHGATGDLNRRYNGKTALMIALEQKRASLASLLLRRDFNPDRTDPYGNTALIYAVKTNDISAVRTLLKKGADPLIRQVEGKNAIDIAREKQLDRIVKMLEKATR